MKNVLFCLLVSTFCLISCSSQDDELMNESDILGFKLLTHLKGHWIGNNETAFGNYDWFSFDFRPISASHLHSIYEGGTNQNIITSIFIANFEGKLQIMARNGGWLGNQYRATYFVLDIANESENSNYYRLVDAVGGEKRAYIEFRFENDTLFFDAYKDNSGTLDEPIHHMGFEGTNYNANFSETATNLFNYPQAVAEVDLNDKFINLIDPDTAMFLEEDLDPFPKSEHHYLSDLKINIEKENAIQNEQLLLYISTQPIVDENLQVNFTNLEEKLIRTIDIMANETSYTTTYLHPDTYYITIFADIDNNFYPSSNDYTNKSQQIVVNPETFEEISINVDYLMN